MVKYDPIGVSFDTPLLIKGHTVQLKPPVKVHAVLICLNPGNGGRSWRINFHEPRRLRVLEIEFDPPEVVDALHVYLNPEETLVAAIEETLKSDKKYALPSPIIPKRK